MKKIIHTVASSLVIFALVVSAIATPVTATASTNTTPGFNFPGIGFPDVNFPDINFPDINFPDVTNPPVTVRSCEVNANIREVVSGGSVTLTWNTSGFDTVTINGQTVSGNSGSVVMSNITANTVYTLRAVTADGKSECEANVSIVCLPPPIVKHCNLEIVKSVNKNTARVGETLTYTLTIENKGNGDCTGDGVKISDVLDSRLTYLTQSSSANITPGYGSIPVYDSANRTLSFNGGTFTPGERGTITVTASVNQPSTCGDFTIPNQGKVTAYNLNNFGTWIYSNTVSTLIDNDCATPDPAPSCDSFTATPNSIVVGGSSTLAWQTSNANRVVINNGIGDVALDGTVTVSPLQTTTYRLTVFGTSNRTVDCSVPVTVSTIPLPVCESFTATPNQLGVGGGSVTLSWATNNASLVSIAPNIGSVAVDGTQTANVTQNTNFVLTATNQTNGTNVTCAAPVTVSTPTPVFTCGNNVSFTASDSSIREGDDTTLNWSTNNVDSLSISVIGATALSGSKTVDPRQDTTYVLTARKGTESINCPLTINVDEDNGGGGGGGSSSPRCELTISDNKIKSGDQITLRWNTSNATEVTIEDDRGREIVSTDRKLGNDKRELLDGSIRLKPTRDTEYTLLAERGSRDRTCKVKVDVEDLLVVRDQQPLVAGISLSDTPYTGFEAGPFLTLMFYALLVVWALFITYLIVLRKRAGVVTITDSQPTYSTTMKRAEDVRPDLFVQSLTMSAAPVPTIPANLPTGTPVIGYENMVISTNPHYVNDELITELENRAHKQKALLSSDAIRHFIATTEGSVERHEALDQVIAEAKASYPMEDGWIVINDTRMRGLCETCSVNQTTTTDETFVPAMVPEGSSSLAEAIVTGNVVAAYAMIGNRPMFALADAAADFDTLLRMRRGEDVPVSNLLAAESASLSDEKMKNIISALTGALDGIYTDEASAVKMAIMKAVKEVA